MPTKSTSVPASPPYIAATDPDEIKRLRALLLQSFSMDEIKASAKPPEPKPAPGIQAPKKEAAPQADTATQGTPGAPEADAETVDPSATAQSAYITMEPDGDAAEEDPVSRAVKIGAAVAAAIVLLLLSISYNNSSKYYLYPKENAIEIWKGRFSPKDTKFYMVLHGVELEEPPAAVYTSQEVYPLIFDYYLNKADTLLEVPGLPDFEGIKEYLNEAKAYAVSNEMRASVASRLNNIERMILLYKADVAMSKGTVDALQNGIKLLKEADVIAASEIQSQEIAAKIEAAREQIAALKATAE